VEADHRESGVADVALELLGQQDRMLGGAVGVGEHQPVILVSVTEGRHLVGLPIEVDLEGGDGLGIELERAPAPVRLGLLEDSL
jgi:hypothetical protein